MEKIIHADCMKILREMKNDSVDLTVTDIPYGEVNRESNGLRVLDKSFADIVTFDLNELVDLLCCVTSGSIYMFCGTEQVSQIRRQMVKNGLATRHCIWEKNNPPPLNGKHMWLSSIENIMFGKKKGATFNEFCAGSVFRHSVGSSKIHPTEKPLLLIERLIAASSNRGDTVLDPFLGSGTTAIAAHRLGRHCIGIELNEEYYNIAKKRIDEETAQISLFDI